MGSRWPDAPWALGLIVAVVAAATATSAAWAWLLVPPVVVVSALAGRHLASLRTALLAFAVAAVVGLVAAVAQRGVAAWTPVLGVLIATGLEVVLPWWLGRSRRLRLEHARRERTVLAEQARSQERARIAADMHDSLGHELALMALRSGALELDPSATERQRSSAAAVRTSAVAATERLHEIIGVLREEVGPPDPLPQDDDVEALVRRARAAGVDVDLRRRSGSGGGLSLTARQVVHRVVQEALTNAAKHAPGEQVVVEVDEAVDPVAVSVRSDLSRHAHPAPVGGGRGLCALEERLRLVGGSLRAAADQGAFWVRAEVPRETRSGGQHRGSDPGWSPAVQQLRRQRRRSLARTSALPVLLAFVVLAALLGVQAVTVWQTALHPNAYAALRVGQSYDEVRKVLPPDSQDEPPPVLAVPPAPVGAICRYFQARAHVLDVSQDMYQLCFREDSLVFKDHLLPRPT
ncbi:sensor histidine kinase [Kineococcus esterisolvens]|uniref:sensor histidine kinase n=1 Tax=unclassified Kineococcus TaxID=2621656 RepID=UPI003D7C7432